MRVALYARVSTESQQALSAVTEFPSSGSLSVT
jgi:DNA invertase Pin-like site-specific DNA recombinase